MSSLRLIAAGLVYHWRIHVAVALGVAAATAVLTGALLVGDSVRGSLRHLALDRLGRIDEVLLSEQFFRAELADEVAGEQRLAESFRDAVPLIVLRGTVEKPAVDDPARASDVGVVGCDARFWQLYPRGSTPPLAAGEVVLNEPLAVDLGAAVGDEVVLRIPLPGDIPSDSPLGEKIDTAVSRRLKVSAVIPATGLGRFGLRPSQQLPRNAYLATQTVQAMLDQPAKVNAILVADGSADQPSTPQASTALAAALRPRAIDYGLSIKQVRIGEEQNPASQYVDISSNRMLLPKPVVAAAAAFADEGLQPALTYLANTIAVGERRIPYSTITGIDPTQPLGPFSLDDGRPLADDEIVLNSWAAEDLGVEPGDEVMISYYLPESTHGRLDEPAPKTFRLRAVVPLAAKDQPPTRANDPHLTPELAGVTDQESIDDWDLPFALDQAKHGKIRPKDEQYWDDHRTTPKAFVTLATARRLWSSRFGDTTSLRIPVTENLTPAAVFDRLDLEAASLGFEFRPVKRLALEASAGTTSFDMLFLGFSFFIIAAAVMLTALLFRLGVERRAEEIGTLKAVGLRRGQIAGLLAGEGLLVAASGALLGVAAGAGYAWLMLAGLRTWWLAAVSTPFLQLHVSPTSLAVGYLVGVGVSLLAIVWSLRRLGGVSVRRLLAGQASEEMVLAGTRSLRGMRFALGLLLVAVVLGLLAMRLSGEAQAGAFFGSGALVLAAVLTLVRTSLRSGGRASADRGSRFALGELATRNAARNSGRSTLTMGLVAAASFLIVALSAFRLDPTEQGTGGFALLAESDQPIVHDIDTPSGRDELAFSAADSDRLGECRTWSLRAREGDDASCLNLYKPREPRVLGVPRDLVRRGGFAWAGSAAATPEEKENPWLLLEKPRKSGAVPVVLDANTAIYSLHLGSFAQSPIGQIYTIDDVLGGTIRFEVVGLLKSSILQGNLLISEANFLRQFPETAGYPFFLVDVPAEIEAETIRRVLEATLGDRGLDAALATQRLAGLLAVQNTYLSTFQSLGALGLLLGTFGLATVQLRNVLERRGELALLRATGFGHRRLATLVMLENVVLLLGGLATGLVAAAVAVLPHVLLGGAAVPWLQLALLLGIVLVVGLLVSLVAVRATLRAPLLAALRGE